jgi:hypothetical protein
MAVVRVKMLIWRPLSSNGSNIYYNADNEMAAKGRSESPIKGESLNPSQRMFILIKGCNGVLQ